MKIKNALIISPFFYPAIGGAETQALNISIGLIKRGYQVTIITSLYTKTILSNETLGEINIIRCQNLISQTLILLLRGQKQDVVIWNGLFNKKSLIITLCQSLLIFVSKLINKKNVFRIPSEVDIIAKNYVIKTIFNYSVSNWLPLTNEQLQYLVNTGVNRSKIIEPPNTIVSNEFFTKRKPKSKSIKTELIYCGRLINQKGLNIFIEALNNLNKDMLIEVTFLLSMSVESPEQARTNLKLLNTLQYPFKIKFESTETATNFAQCDIGIFSSLKEGAPNVVREMMASGLAVVASDIPGCSEIINNNQNGLLFRVGSISELANKLRYLLKSRLLIKKLGTNARNTILESCSEDKIMTKILK